MLMCIYIYIMCAYLYDKVGTYLYIGTNKIPQKWDLDNGRKGQGMSDREKKARNKKETSGRN